ncbi:hypothetical protein PR048_007925 [Dryococelus australis]|uniref:Uncharacterized protein n=1 Tax=Dryococelus australis TaxID=614101 RepID=A0ABQ9HVN0_9NEOP|nr:hypothetical protein PR048_007925 [Dryococelus australis]
MAARVILVVRRNFKEPTKLTVFPSPSTRRHLGLAVCLNPFSRCQELRLLMRDPITPDAADESLMRDVMDFWGGSEHRCLERLMRVIEVSMEQRRNKRAGEAGDPRKPDDQSHRPSRFPLTKVRRLHERDGSKRTWWSLNFHPGRKSICSGMKLLGRLTARDGGGRGEVSTIYWLSPHLCLKTSGRLNEQAAYPTDSNPNDDLTLNTHEELGHGYPGNSVDLYFGTCHIYNRRFHIRPWNCSLYFATCVVNNEAKPLRACKLQLGRLSEATGSRENQ